MESFLDYRDGNQTFLLVSCVNVRKVPSDLCVVITDVLWTHESDEETVGAETADYSWELNVELLQKKCFR